MTAAGGAGPVLGLLAAASLAAMTLAGCSQTRALAPVGGDRLAEIRFATNDVLVGAHVQILTAPVCTASGAKKVDIVCRGTTTENTAITARSTSSHQADLTVTVGSRTIYHGPYLAVLDAAARPSS